MKLIRETITIDESNKNQVALNGKIIISHPKGGCGLETCNCSPGHWISVIEPLQDGKINVTKFEFESRKELEKHLEMC